MWGWEKNEELTRLLADELPGSELNSLLLHVMRERSHSVTWADALRLVERNGLVRADTADARVLTELDARAFAAAGPVTNVAGLFGLH